MIMSETESSEYDSVQEQFIYLDFNNLSMKINAFENTNCFFRIADLDKPEPLVQLNDSTFKGKFEFCAGTNLIFVEDPSSASETCDVFKKSSTMALKFLLKQSKVIHLEPINIQNIQTSKSSETFNLNLKHKYRATLGKFAEKTLKLEDLIKKDERIDSTVLDQPGNLDSTGQKWDVQNAPMDASSGETSDAAVIDVSRSSSQERNKPSESSENTETIDSEMTLVVPNDGSVNVTTHSREKSRLQAKYEKLKQLASQPVRRNLRN